MALSHHDQARIREYLLGHLSDEEQQKIEERLMTEDDLFEELEISKGELIEEYRAGELSSSEHDWFEHHYLASPEGRQRHTFSIALSCIQRPISQPQRPGLLERLESFLKIQRWAVATATSAVLIAVIGVAWYISRPRPSFAITLNTSAINRSLNAPRYTQIRLKPDVEEVRISLRLPEPASAGTNYRIELDNRQETTALKPSTQDASSVLVVIPSKQLPPGLYSLILFTTKSGSPEQRVGDYFFEVTN
jgi:hypothetical protein